MCAVQLSTAVSYEYWLMAVVEGFHCDVIGYRSEVGMARPGQR